MTQTSDPDRSPLSDAAPLTEAERADYQRLEKTIALGQGNYIEVGLALEQIRDRRLYRERFPTFSRYCEVVWTMSAERARQLRRAALVVQAITTTTDGRVLLPENEKQARALMAFPAHRHSTIMELAYATARALNQSLSEGLITRTGQALDVAARTGTADTGDGTSTPIVAALTAEQHEAMQRQIEYMREKSQRVKVAGQVYYCGDDYYRVAVDAALIDPGALKVGDTVAVIYTPRGEPVSEDV